MQERALRSLLPFFGPTSSPPLGQEAHNPQWDNEFSLYSIYTGCFPKIESEMRRGGFIFFLEIWFFLRFYMEVTEKMNPILGKPPSKLRKESNSTKFKQILGKHQNKIQEKWIRFKPCFCKSQWHCGNKQIYDKKLEFFRETPTQNLSARSPYHEHASTREGKGESGTERGKNGNLTGFSTEWTQRIEWKAYFYRLLPPDRTLKQEKFRLKPWKTGKIAEKQGWDRGGWIVPLWYNCSTEGGHFGRNPGRPPWG